MRPDSLPERKKLPELQVCSLSHIDDHFDLIKKYSSMSKLINIVAYILRFAFNCRNKARSQTDKLNVEELDQSLTVIVKMVQLYAFSDELNALKGSKPLKASSSILAMNPFIDDQGILRVGSRIARATLAYDTKFPILLPHNHHFTNILIIYEHKRHLHAGVQTTLTAIRQRFWIIKGKSTVKKILNKCVTCFRFKPKFITQQMAELPASRVTPCRPFLISGTDFAGPFLIKDGRLRNRRLVKAYICIFVCFSTKAVHIELVGDLTTESFLNAFKRFVSRRGLCTDVYSDNGTNFVGANNELKEIYALFF